MDYTRTPVSEQQTVTPKHMKMKQEQMDVEMNSPFNAQKFVKEEVEPMEIGTPKRQPLSDYVNTDSNIVDVRMTPGDGTPGKQGTHPQGLFQTTPKSSKRDSNIIHEEIIISPDASKPLLQTRPPSTSNLSVMSLASAFQPQFNSTECYAVESPDIFNQSKNSRNSSGYSPAERTKMAAQISPSRQPFQSLVAESPEKSYASSGKHRLLSDKSSGTDGNNSCFVDSEGENDDPVIIDDSVVLSEGEEKENVEPGNISVHDIRDILQKSLGNAANDSINESPVMTKSRRKSTAYRRRVIESSDEDNEEDNDINKSLPDIGSNSDHNEKELQKFGEHVSEELVENIDNDDILENESDGKEQNEAKSTDIENQHIEDDNDIDMYADNEADDDDDNDDAEDDDDNVVEDDIEHGNNEHDGDKDAETSVNNGENDDAVDVENSDEDDDDEMSDEESEEEAEGTKVISN